MARLNMLRGGQKRRSAVAWCSNLVSFDSGDVLRQGGALGHGKVVHLLARCTVYNIRVYY